MAWRDGDPRPTHPRIATPSCWPGIGRARWLVSGTCHPRRRDARPLPRVTPRPAGGGDPLETAARRQGPTPRPQEAPHHFGRHPLRVPAQEQLGERIHIVVVRPQGKRRQLLDEIVDPRPRREAAHVPFERRTEASPLVGASSDPTTAEAGELRPRDPVEGREHRQVAPLEGKTANTPRVGPVSTSRQWIAELARQAVGMAVAIAWLPGPAGTRRRGLSVEEPDAAEPARPDLWGARVSNDPGLPDPIRTLPHDSSGRC